MKKNIIFLISFTFAFTSLFAQSIEKGAEAIQMSSIKAQLSILAADWMEGRESGTKGELMAGDYIASMLQLYGIEPFGDTEYAPVRRQEWMAGKRPVERRTYFQQFNLIKYRIDADKQSLSIIEGNTNANVAKSYLYGVDYLLLNVENNLEFTAPVVFVGYGINDSPNGYNDFAKLDVRGKIIARIDGFPGSADTSSEGYKKFKYENIRKLKEQWAKDAGAIAVINLSRSSDKQFMMPTNLDFYFKRENFESDVPMKRFGDYRARLASDIANETLPEIRLSTVLQQSLLQKGGIDITEFVNQTGKSLKPASRVIPAFSVKVTSGIESELVAVRNVLGCIEGKNKNEYIVVGAHYDHVGKYNGQVYNGADDNASGTVGVLEIAKAIQASGIKPDKSIIFAAWTAEERGLYGSQYFVNKSIPNEKILFNLNMDMISRSSERDSTKKQFEFEFTKKYKGFQSLAEVLAKDMNLNLEPRFSSTEQPMGGSDFSPFSEKGLPIISLFAGMHSDYHQPSDEISKIDWNKMEQIIKLAYGITFSIANQPVEHFIATENEMEKK